MTYFVTPETSMLLVRQTRMSFASRCDISKEDFNILKIRDDIHNFRFHLVRIVCSRTQATEAIHNFRDWCCHLCNGRSSTIQRYMIVLAYLWSQCTKVYAAGWMCWFLHNFIWSRVSGLMRFRHGSDEGTASEFVQLSEKVRRLEKHSGKRAWIVYGKSPNS
jgi:hypothetical protein